MSTIRFLINTSPCWVLLVLWLVGVCWVGQLDIESAMGVDRTYCRMVEAWRDTDGAYGWPDYEGIYNQACNPTSTPIPNRVGG